MLQTDLARFEKNTNQVQQALDHKITKLDERIEERIEKANKETEARIEKSNKGIMEAILQLKR